MHDIDTAIQHDKRRHRRLIFVGLSALCILSALYLFWLFGVRVYSVQVVPEEAALEAKITIDQGVGIWWRQRLYALSASLDVDVSAQTFLSKRVRVDKSSPSQFTVELLPKPAELTITTYPSFDNSRWLVNGEWVMSGSTLSQTLPEGEVSVRLEQPFVENYQQTFTLSRAQNLNLTWQLTPVVGELRIASVPSGAEVWVNGILIGETPYSKQIDGGQYQIELKHPDFEVLSDTVAVTQQQPTAIRNYPLRPKQALLNVNTSPSGGVLLVNGKPVTSPISLEAGKQHDVRYEKPGFIDQQRLIKLSPGENASLSFNLLPSVGKVVLTSTPSATVSIAGKVQGETPITLILPTVPTTMSLTANGYRALAHSLVPVRDASTNVNLRLFTEFAARRREGKPLVIDGLGIRMQRVEATTFTMGSPPNEPFRAPNETRYDVQLRKPFWLSLHEVTEAQFAVFDATRKGRGQEPVTDVSWLQAAMFANWLSAQEGLTPFYVIENGRLRSTAPSSAGYRLPTEAEWEFVAKHYMRSAPTQYVWGSQDVLRKNQGNFADKQLKGKQTFVLANYEDGFAGKAPVGSFKADRNGFFDLDGNVREWVHDFYILSPTSSQKPLIDYQGPSSGSAHVIKGGSFQSGRMKELRASIRDQGNEGLPDVGFRLARYLEESER